DPTDVPAVYLQQCWKTVSKVPDTEDAIKFKVGYQGVVDKMSAFYTKNLAQPWQTMFKVFNRCLTTRTSRHDQTKINILQLFHVVVNRINVDFAALLWWDFINCVSQKKDYILYPHFTKLIIADLMKKYETISLRIEEDYHSIKDDIPLVSVYTIGNVTVRGMMIPDEFLTEEIRATDDYKEYEMVFVGIDVLMNQPQSVVSTQGTHMSIPRAHKTPTLTTASPQGKKRKKSADKSDKYEQSYDDADESDDRLELGSHKENPKHVDDDDDKEKVDEKKDDEIGVLRRMCRRQGYKIKNMEQKYVTTKYFCMTHTKVDRVLHEIVPQLAERATDYLIENNLKPSIAVTIIEDHDAFRSEVPDLASQEFNAQAPKIIEEIFKNYVQNNVIQVHPTTTTSTKKTLSADPQQQIHDDHQEDDAPPEGEKRVKRHKTSKSLNSARGSSSKKLGKDSTTYVSKQQHQQQEWDAWVEERSIPCSPECKIVGKILLDHPFYYALTATADVPAVYLQQFWQIVHKVPDTKDTIRFKLNTQEITYTVDMFHYTLKLPMETPDNPFITPLFHAVVNRTNVNYVALLWWDFMNNVFKKKNVIQYPRFIKLIIDDLMEKFPSIPRRHDEDYHSIKDDTPLVSVYSIGNVLFRGMRIPDAFLTAEIRATDDYKEYEMLFVGVDVPVNQLQPVVSTQGTHRQKKQTTTPIPPPGDDRERDEVAEATILSLTLHKTDLDAEAQENIAKVQEKLDEEEIEKMVEGDKDEESYASEFVDSMINDDVDDSEMKDDEIEKEETNDDVEKMNVVVKEKDNDEGASGSVEFRNEKMHTPIPTPTRSPRKDLSSDKTTFEELTAIVSPTLATTSKDSKIREVLDHCNNVVPELTFAKTNEIMNKEIPRLVNLADNKVAKTNEIMNKEIPRLVNLAINNDHEVDPINVQEIISKGFVTHGPKMIKELFRKHMQNTTLNIYPTTQLLENQRLIFNNSYI
ncbi:hypothetical protein Tco_0676790, partial [Tanacetum coccineum]